MVCALIKILRNAAPNDREETMLDRALQVLDERHAGIPVLRDLGQGRDSHPLATTSLCQITIYISPSNSGHTRGK